MSQIPTAKVRPHPPQTIAERGLRFTGEEKRRLFRGMVVAELEAGYLRYSRRQELMKYAGYLSIPEFEAALLIAEAQFRAGDIEPITFSTAATFDNLTQPQRWSCSMRLAFALTTAAFIDVAIIYWWLG